MSKPNPAILQAAASDDPGCGKEFNLTLCRLRHTAAKLREERGRRREYEPCAYCPRFVRKPEPVPEPIPEELSEKIEESKEKPMKAHRKSEKACTVCGHALTIGGHCRSCAGRKFGKMSGGKKKSRKTIISKKSDPRPDGIKMWTGETTPAPVLGVEKPICNETAPKVTQEKPNVTLEPAANTIHAAPPPHTAQPTQSDVYRLALRKYGDRNQMMKTAEEASELSAAISRYMAPVWNGNNHLTNLIGELADVEIMCRQMRLVFGDRLIDEAVKQKLARLERRLTDE